MDRPWYITDHALECYVHARRWPDTDESWDRAERELLHAASTATWKQTDAAGRQLWRSPRSAGGLRWLIDPRPKPGFAGPEKPRVIWVGQGRPPVALWSASDD